MKKPLIYGLIIMIVTACGDASENRKNGYSSEAKNPEDSLFQAVMDGHDAAMAKMGKLAGYRKQFEQKIDSIKKVKSSAKAQLKQNYEEISGKLKDAEDRMNTWMHEFSIDSAQDNVERRLKYLADEKMKVETVRDEINKVIARADSLLAKGQK
jgi:hypothetical protein